MIGDGRSEPAISELHDRGYCVLRHALAASLIDACRDAFWPVLLRHLSAGNEPNRGPQRHFLPMSFAPPCFSPGFFFNDHVLQVVHGAMDDRVVADQWACDVPLLGSEYQCLHVDYRRPLFAEVPDLLLPPYMLVVSFGLMDITPAHGPIEIARGTHRMARSDALRAVESGEIKLQAVPLEIGDVLIRHPWALHRGTPNTTGTPRVLIGIRYVRRWYSDNSRDVNPIPRYVWRSLTPEQQSAMSFPVEG